MPLVKQLCMSSGMGVSSADDCSVKSSILSESTNEDIAPKFANPVCSIKKLESVQQKCRRAKRKLEKYTCLIQEAKVHAKKVRLELDDYENFKTYKTQVAELKQHLISTKALQTHQLSKLQEQITTSAAFYTQKILSQEEKIRKLQLALSNQKKHYKTVISKLKNSDQKPTL